MAVCSLDALTKSLKKKETGIEKEIVEVLRQASDRRKKKEKQKIKMMKFLAFTSHLLARLTLTLTSTFVFIDCF